jgi:hypothetical protein
VLAHPRADPPLAKLLHMKEIFDNHGGGLVISSSAWRPPTWSRGPDQGRRYISPWSGPRDHVCRSWSTRRSPLPPPPDRHVPRFLITSEACPAASGLYGSRGRTSASPAACTPRPRPPHRSAGPLRPGAAA